MTTVPSESEGGSRGPTARLARTRPGSPSKLATLLACPLRYLLETENTGKALIGAHPAILLGTAVHNAAETLQGRATLDAADCVSLLEANFAALIADEARSSPVTSWVRARFGMAGIVSRRQLLGQAAFAKALAERFRSGKGRRDAGGMNSRGAIPLGAEKWLASATLGIGGRVDLICEDGAEAVRIVDFKTGRVNDDDGNPKAAYLLQLAAYGRIAHELDPGKVIKLELIGKADAWMGTFDATLKALADAALAYLHAVLPIGATFAPKDLARAGLHCAQCSYRPSCDLYSTRLQNSMSAGSFDYEASPLDIYGEVLEVCAAGEAISTIRCRVKNGNTIAVSRIPNAMLLGIEKCKGKKLRAYALGSLEAKREAAFPCNFFVLDLETPRDSAFQATLMLD